eukprot:CAMPEP_0197542144 /NCGR_PEP_ID=MMETSP1318-20131121/67547_1 /TAXON_ID=552666 /ORGANISM="Partenskyella glossopodia, Strain RCC365" /LENGTH=341 /DNA_ID=CAMNT_0043101387 /DNA_START=65 /DNA_END=1090 /DNA_ORIENTATION=+
MTFGVQNNEKEAFAMLDYAYFERGVTFFDTAEMYPVPPSEETQGASERILGKWISERKIRDKVVIATKITGRSRAKNYVTKQRGQGERKESDLDEQSILLACDKSLERLGVKQIDLYQLHWPSRYIPLFGRSRYDVRKEKSDFVSYDEQVIALGKLIKAGKIKYWGLSNESTWGVSQFLNACTKHGVPPPITIQNSYSLLHRNFEYELAEACSPSNGNISLLPWSVLAGGRLTGKYMNGKKPEKSRNAMFPSFQSRYFRDRLEEPVSAYMDIAKQSGLTLAKLAQAFCKAQWFIGSTIIGATSLDQLKENIDAFDVELSSEVLEKIDEVHVRYPNASNLDG